MSVQPSVAVVILNWNGCQYLQQFLPSVMAATYRGQQVVVADNASTDDSVAFLRAHYPQVTVLENKENEGFARGYNTALRQVKADYYVLLNSDVAVTPGWIEPVIELMESDPAIGACQPKLLAWHQQQQFEYAGASGGWIDSLGYPFSRGRIFDICETDEGQYNDPAPCFWASGAALFIRSALYHQAGGLDPYFFAHQEEIDLCWRIQRMGYTIYVQPASVVYHVGGGTLPKGNSRKVWLNFRNNLIMLAKNLPLSMALWKIPFRMALDAVAAWKGLLNGDTGYFLAIGKAHGGFLYWCLFVKKQMQPLPARKSTLPGWHKGYIIWQHFIRKKTKFSEIVGNK